MKSRGPHRLDVGIGKIAVIVRLFLRAHQRGLPLVVVPAARLLLDRAAASRTTSICRAISYSSARRTPLMLFRFFISLLVPNSSWPSGRTEMLHVAAHLALFHVGIADAAVDRGFA